MAINLRGRSFVKLLDYTAQEIQYLLDLSRDLKRDKYLGNEHQHLKDKNVVLLFQKDSTRTRCAFEVGALDLGMGATYLGPNGSQMNVKESIKDTARVLGRMYDGIEFRGYYQDDVEVLAKYAGVPVWNGLTNEFHPTQILADFMTMIEKKGKLKGLNFVFVGDARNNMGNSLMVGCAKMGINFTALAPKSLWPDAELVKICEEIAEDSGSTISLTEDVKEATTDADAIYTDVWVSMGEDKSVWEERIKLLLPYQVNMQMLNNAKEDVLFMHCLPAFHDLHTEVAKSVSDNFPDIKNGEMEVTDEVFESKMSVVFDQAENRMHTIKAVMLATIGG